MTRKEQMSILKTQIKAHPFYGGYDEEIEWGWGRVGKIMFIGQAPANSNRTGMQGDSNFDKFFFELLEPMGLTRKDFYFTNLVKRPREITDISNSDLVDMTGHLLEEVTIIQPDVIITLGNHAKEWFGKLNINFYSLPHPAALRYRSITEDDWRKKLKEILTTNKLLKRNQTNEV